MLELPCEDRQDSFVAGLAGSAKGNRSARDQGADPLREGSAFDVTIEARQPLDIMCWFLSDRDAQGAPKPTGFIFIGGQNGLRVEPGQPFRFNQGSLDRATPPGSPDLVHCVGAPQFSRALIRDLTSAAADYVDARRIQRLLVAFREEPDMVEAVFWVDVVKKP